MSFITFCHSLEWYAYGIAVIGAIGCALSSAKLRFFGFIISICADVLWGLFGYSVHSTAMALMQITYISICGLGVWCNRPRLWYSSTPR
jgi:hypothetical protein